MAAPRVLITSSMLHPGDAVDRFLKENGADVVFSYWHAGRTEDELISLVGGVNGAIVSIDPFTSRVFEAAPQLKVISRTGVGYDSIDVSAATRHGVYVCTTPGTNNVSVAEFAFAMIITHSKRVLENLSEVRRGGWKPFQGRELSGATLGIVGLGSIGKELARRARAFGMTVLAYDVKRDEVFASEHDVTYSSLEELLRNSDYVSLHLFLDATTRHLINAERLAQMKPTAYLVNTSRGPVVDQEALCAALREKRIAGAALDVFESEPLEADSPLRSLDNVCLTPHVAGRTSNSEAASGMMAAENVVRVLRGEPPVYAVNSKELPW